MPNFNIFGIYRRNTMTLEISIEKEYAPLSSRTAKKKSQLRILEAVIEKKAGTPAQRNAILRIIKQCESKVYDNGRELGAGKLISTLK